MRITFLGTGTSQGIPVIACKCAVCTSSDSRDRRFRSSVMIEASGKVIVVEPKWGFVVLDIPAESQLCANVDLTVQRKDLLIGKVHVAAVFVNRRLAVAEMIDGWEQKPAAVGDLVFF